MKDLLDRIVGAFEPWDARPEGLPVASDEVKQLAAQLTFDARWVAFCGVLDMWHHMPNKARIARECLSSLA